MNKNPVIRVTSFTIEWLLPVVIWLLYSNIGWKTIIGNEYLRLCGLLGIFLLIVLNFTQIKAKSPAGLVIANIGYLITLYLLTKTLPPLIISLLLINLVGADLLTSDVIINDPYSKWVTFALVNGIGVVIATRMIVSNFLTNAQLLLIVTLIFANLLFSYPRFIDKQLNWGIIGAVGGLLILTEIMLGLTFQQIMIGLLTMVLFILLERKINPKLKKSKWNLSICINLIFALSLIL
ncbi:hypothetical protein [Lentilactobacillus senioris]|uniref:hypothetical protein n=1 Tax=Lentilactobacillus senioris TaxID=931534 RepID=UPI003D29B841